MVLKGFSYYRTAQPNSSYLMVWLGDKVEEFDLAHTLS